MYLVLTHLVGGAGGYWGKKKGIPAGAMIGALLAVALMNTLVGHAAHYPPNLRVIVQILSGLIIGSRFTREDVKALRVMGKPILILLTMMFTFTILFSVLMQKISGLSFMTSLFACSPGGMSDLSLIAVDFGASTDKVMLLQLFRFVIVVMFFPNIIKKLYLSTSAPAISVEDSEAEPKKEESSRQFSPEKLKKFAVSLVVSSAGALLLRFLGVPAGAIIGAILATVVLSVASDLLSYPSFVKVLSRVLAGCYIGSQISRATWAALGELVIPMIIMAVEVFVMSFVTAYLLSRFTGMNKATALFCCTPGGIAEMGLIAEELGLDTPKIVLMHSCRLISVICLIPVLANIFT